MTSDRWLRGYIWRWWNHSCGIWCTIGMMYLTGEMGHPPRRKCDKIYKRNVSSFRDFFFKKLSWVFPVNHSQQYKTTPPSPAVSLPFFKLNRPSDGSKLSQNRESWGKKLQKEPASQANPFNVNNSGRKWSPSMHFLRFIIEMRWSFWCRDIPWRNVVALILQCITPVDIPSISLQGCGVGPHHSPFPQQNNFDTFLHQVAKRFPST